MKKRRVEITVEEKWLVFRRGGVSPIVVCDRCPAQPLMLAPEDAAILAGVSTRALYRALEAGRIHFTEVQDGARKRLLVCLDSANSLTTAEPETGHTTNIQSLIQQGDDL